MSQQDRPISMAEWRKNQRKRDRLTILALFGFVMLLVVAIAITARGIS